MLDAKFFLWPYPGVDLNEAINKISPMLQKSALGIYIDDPSIGGNLAEYIALVCRNWNINPAWVMVSAQREQSTLTTPAADFKRSARAAWLGFVGQDVGRTTKPGYYGVYTQVERCCEQTAWLHGTEANGKWPPYLRAAKESRRFYPGVSLNIERNGSPVKYYPKDAGEYVQLKYTPHWAVLDTNESIAEKFGLLNT